MRRAFCNLRSSADVTREQVPQGDAWRTQETMALIHAVLKYLTPKSYSLNSQTPNRPAALQP